MSINPKQILERCVVCDWFSGDPSREDPKERTFFHGECSVCSQHIDELKYPPIGVAGSMNPFQEHSVMTVGDLLADPYQLELPLEPLQMPQKGGLQPDLKGGGYLPSLNHVLTAYDQAIEDFEDGLEGSDSYPPPVKSG